MDPPFKKKLKISVPIDDLALQPNLIRCLKDAKLTTLKSILHLSVTELQKTVKISLSEAKNILSIVSEGLLNNNIYSGLTLLKEQTELTKHNFIPDILKNGSGVGLCTGTITEISGESGCGKTQLCLHLSLQAQKPTDSGGLDCKVVYIHSEGDFPIKRFHQMASAFKNENPNLHHLRLSDNIILKKVFNSIEMMHILKNGIPDLLQKTKAVKVIVIDSVAALLRCEYQSLNSRTSMLQQLAYEIWKLANQYRLVVICVNQVSGVFNNKQVGSVCMNIPSLGLLWSNILTTRIKISRKCMTQDNATRMLEIIFSSYLPTFTKDFMINHTGIKAI